MINRKGLMHAWIKKFTSVALTAGLCFSLMACNGDSSGTQGSLIVYTTSATTEKPETTEITTEQTTKEETTKASLAESSMPETDVAGSIVETEEESSTEEPSMEEPVDVVKAPKYIFLFVGDGMGYSQIQATAYYKAATSENGGIYSESLNFMKFPVVGNVINYNADSFITDSASSITAIASGNKTVTDRINISPDGSNIYETIAEKLKKQKGFQIGVASNANINHATPAGFYAHQLERTLYYEIGQEILVSDFNYFGGGAIRNPKGADGTWKDLYELIAANGYDVFTKDSDLDGLRMEMDHVLAVSDQKAEGGSMSFAMDYTEGLNTLADYVRGGITVMSDADGFFFGIESGLSDFAAHENDAGSVIKEVLALEAAVDEALKFYEEHPDETLIIVTADHETGGFALGDSSTGYTLYPQGLANQKISYWKYLVENVNGYRLRNASWDDVVWEMRSLFGLTIKNIFQEGDDPKLMLNEWEEELLYQAYKKSMAGEYAQAGTQEYELYGDGDPLAHTIVALLGKKCGFDFSTVYHTAQTIPIYAIGAGSENFQGVMDNTEIAKKLEALMEVE